MQKGNLKRNSDQASSSIPKRGSKGSKSAGSNRNVSYSTKKHKKSGLQDDSPKNFSSSAEEEETQEAATSTAQETVHRSDSIPKAPSTIENFEELRNSSVNYAFVDKTPLIKRIIEHEDKTMLILRPRRWGKSLNLSMLYSYLSNKKANEFDKLFKGTQIYGDKAFMTSHANQYPVIYIDFSKFALKTTVTDESWPGRSFCTSLAQVQKDYEKRIQDTKVKTLSRTAKDQALNHFNEKHAGLANAIQHLSYALNQMFNKNVIVLIDEYDLPIHKQLNAGSDDDMKSLLNFYKDFLEIGLKNNTNMFKCVMTGCARVGLTDTLSGLNNFNSYSMLDKDFHEFYGFSQAEVLSLIKSIRVTPEIDEDERKAIKSYYNGYICPAGSKCTEIYNAYSIVKYAASGKFDAFWNMAGGDSLIVRAFRNKEADTEEKLYKLIAGEEIKVNLSPKITLEMLETAEVIGATLFYAGYVTLAKDKLTPVKDRPEVDKERDVYAIKVPNAEVTEALIDLLKRLHIKMQGSTDIQIRDAFISDELDLFVKQVNIWISKQKTSENITGRTLSSEPCYHNLLYWNMSRILEKQFIVRSERYAGKGFFDIVVFPQRGKELSTAYVFEIKFLAQTFDDNKAAKMAKMDEAKHQINDRRYLDYFNNNKEFDYIGTKKKFGILGCNSKIELYDFQ